MRRGPTGSDLKCPACVYCVFSMTGTETGLFRAVINWQYTPVHNATAPSWTALVLIAPFPEAILVEYVSTDRLVAVRDPSPADG